MFIGLIGFGAVYGFLMASEGNLLSKYFMTLVFLLVVGVAIYAEYTEYRQRKHMSESRSLYLKRRYRNEA